MKHIGGMGGVRIEFPGEAGVTLTKEQAWAEIQPKEVKIERTDANFNGRKWHKGYDILLPITFINTKVNDYLLYRTLAQLIDISNAEERLLRVYPHYNPAAYGSLYYDCMCDGDWNWEDIWKNVERGQTLPGLKFKTMAPVKNLPRHTDVLLPGVRVTRAGDRRVTCGGDVRVVLD